MVAGAEDMHEGLKLPAGTKGSIDFLANLSS